MIDFASDINRPLCDQLQHFWIKINERTLNARGILPSYDTGGDPVIAPEVEFFHFSICADSRMKYIGENFVCADVNSISERNQVSNAVISHLYGGRRIHTLFTGITDPLKAVIDFERIASGDAGYVQSLQDNVTYARAHSYKFWATTELHTSLQTAARNFVRKKYNEPERAAGTLDIIEWVASWINDGLTDEVMYNTPTLAKAYEKICTLPGVGAYYGYHLAVDFSLFHMTPYRHDEAFVMPGPGCCEVIKQLFPNLSKQKKFPYGDAVVWLADNQKTLFPQLTFHEELWNITANGKKMFPFEQDKLMSYGTEVGTCQFGVYQHLKRNPHLIEKRKCGSDPDITPILLREQGNPIEPVLKNTKKLVKAVQSKSSLLEFDE